MTARALRSCFQRLTLLTSLLESVLLALTTLWLLMSRNHDGLGMEARAYLKLARARDRYPETKSVWGNKLVGLSAGLLRATFDGL